MQRKTRKMQAWALNKGALEVKTQAAQFSPLGFYIGAYERITISRVGEVKSKRV
jgi:hypothetical protein